MLFHTIGFAIFLIVTFCVFWFIIPKKVTFQNAFLVLVSYIFYGFWDYRFLFLLMFSTLLDFYTGHKIFQSKTQSNKKIWLWTSIFINITLLGFFKYFNFFVESSVVFLDFLGLETNITYLNIILPVGISFYTFHGISYVLDIYNNKIKPTNDLLAYSLFVSFFPLLVAGPIERASHLLPQLKYPRIFSFNQGNKGIKQIVWGLFKKMVIADNCQELSDYCFSNFDTLPSSALILGAIFFSFQIYGDFSGYSDIAIGVGNLFGIQLLRNFSYPYFTENIVEFWRSWHISLTSWFKDYIYLPLGGSHVPYNKKARNILLIFLISGLWHGANWTFVFWGLLNALFYLVYTQFKTVNFIKNSPPHTLIKSTGKQSFIRIFLNFILITFLWIFFRSTSISNAFSYLANIISTDIVSNPFIIPELKYSLLTILLLLLFIVIEWRGRANDFAIEKLLTNNNLFLKIAFYGFIIFLIGMYSNIESSPFIYFQF